MSARNIAVRPMVVVLVADITAESPESPLCLPSRSPRRIGKIHLRSACGINFDRNMRVTFHSGFAAASPGRPSGQIDERPDRGTSRCGQDPGAVDQHAAHPGAARAEAVGLGRVAAVERAAAGTPRRPRAWRKIAGSGLAAPAGALAQTAPKRSATPRPASTSGRLQSQLLTTASRMPAASRRSRAGSASGWSVNRRASRRISARRGGGGASPSRASREHPRAVEAQGREGRGVAAAVVVEPVEGDLGAECGGHPLVRMLVAGVGQEGPQAGHGIVKIEEGSVGVEENCLDGDPCGGGLFTRSGL